MPAPLVASALAAAPVIVTTVLEAWKDHNHTKVVLEHTKAVIERNRTAQVAIGTTGALAVAAMGVHEAHQRWKVNRLEKQQADARENGDQAGAETATEHILGTLEEPSAAETVLDLTAGAAHGAAGTVPGLTLAHAQPAPAIPHDGR